MKKIPNVLWAVWGNGYGLQGPKQVFWNAGLKTWWARNGNDEIRRLGFNKLSFHFTFASEDKREVETFIRGYKACANVVRQAVSH